jgi:hypothetical protein
MKKAILALAVVLAACVDGPVAPDGAPGLAVVAGPSLIDTIGAYPTQLLVVDVRDLDGRSVANTPVEFTSSPSEDGATVHSIHEVRMTDASGRATTRIRYGLVAGLADLTITAPEVGVSTQLRYEIRPGRPVQVEVPDQVITLGDTVALALIIRDRNANPVEEVLAVVERLDGAVAVAGDGRRVYGTAPGTGTVRVTVAGMTDAAVVTVVPFGALVGYRPALGTAGPAFVAQSIDGANERTLAPGLAVVPAGLDFDPATGMLAYADVARNRIMIVESATSQPRVLTGEAAFQVQRAPRFGPGGAVYFYGERAGESGVYRATAAGALALVAEGVPESDVSPDGARLAFARDGSLFIQAVAGGTPTPLGVAGRLPRWSPDGSRIAFVTPAGGIAVLDVDTKAVVANVTVPGTLHSLDWSPMGRWLVTSSAFGVHLVEVATGRVVTVPEVLLFPSWEYVREG